MRFIFEDNEISSANKKIAQDLIRRNGQKSGNIKVEYIPDNELECYEDGEGFIEKYQDTCEIYMVYFSTSGGWDQPLSLVAVEN